MTEYNGEKTNYLIEWNSDGRNFSMNIGTDPSEALKVFRRLQERVTEPKICQETVYYLGRPQDFKPPQHQEITVAELEATIQGEATQVMTPPAVLDEVAGFGD